MFIPSTYWVRGDLSVDSYNAPRCHIELHRLIKRRGTTMIFFLLLLYSWFCGFSGW